MKIVEKTHTGLIREQNQDFIKTGKCPLGIYGIIADGMGGHSGGELASEMAVKELEMKINTSEVIQIKTWIEEVNSHLYNYSLSTPELTGMGTTLTLGLISNNMLYIGHVGDSRAYLLRGNELCQLTTDHSFVQELINLGDITKEEANNHPRKNILTQAVGTAKEVEIQVLNQSIQSNDIILLCSDGLTNLVTNDEISQILQSYQIEECAEKLLDTALSRGGNDNISLIIISCEGGVN